MPATSRFLQSFGFLGSLIAAACCLGIFFVVAGVTAIGAGFLIRDRYLLPIFTVFLLLSVIGTALSRRKHGRKGPLVISVSGAIVTFGGVLLRPAIAYVGIALPLLASVLDLLAARSAPREPGR
ncbi:MAG: MerC family mercury resistance protein [Acidobacteria bacterium]|nr:MerC family mercury resistance protein [Acidobacteriota bacterium]MCA1610232.1 MerC family mercury resistance protein [Acidobacteriota bacterium]